MTDARAQKLQNLKFRFHHELEEVYHRFFDELADSGLGDGDAGRVAQSLLLSRQESLKHLVSPKEMSAYLEVYPEDATD